MQQMHVAELQYTQEHNRLQKIKMRSICMLSTALQKTTF